MKRFLPEVAVVCALLMAVGYGFAQTWTRTSAPIGPFSCFAESADGKVILAIGSGGYISTDSGGSWNYAFNGYYPCAAVSADGSNMVACIVSGTSKFIDISTNTGATWNQTTLPSTNWNAGASSADGRVLAVAVGNDYSANTGNIYTSTNFGADWRTNGPVKNWRGLACSPDGAKLAAVANSDYVYLSTNSGLTWKSSGASGSWRSLAASSDLQVLVATGDGGTAITTNGGSTWRTIGMTGYGVASSADGSRLILVNDGTAISTSTNYGLTWGSTNITAATYLAGTGSSADGCELVVGGNNNDGIWIWQASPSPKLSLATWSNNVTLSWPVPSTNFGVEQSADLAAVNWVALTNLPVLNYTNLQNQVTLPSTSGSAFYRLASP